MAIKMKNFQQPSDSTIRGRKMFSRPLLEDEKENKRSVLGLRGQKKGEEPPKAPPEQDILEADKLLSSQSTSKVKLKPLGFWSKKLQDLEENETKNKKYGLYEFSETDESESCSIKKKKPQKKAMPKRKKQTSAVIYKKQVKKTVKVLKSEKKIHKQAAKLKHKNLDGKENKKLIFSTEKGSYGISSTPAVKTDNLVGASNFLFLSPIIKEEVQHCNIIDDRSPLKPCPPLEQLNQETPKMETKLKRISCRRVLRSGKMLSN